MSLLALEGVWAGYGDRAVLRGIDLRLERGEVVCVVGQSGSGKSTLLRCAARLLEPDAGRVLLEGRDVSHLRGKALRRCVPRLVQVVFQDPAASFPPRRTVGASIAEPLVVHGLCPRRALAARVAALARSVGLDASLLHRRPAALSGGQMQRAALARALAVEPRVLLLDEPTSALDATVAGRILALLEGLRRRERLGMLLVTHDLTLAAAFGDRIAVLLDGRIVEIGDALAVYAAPRHPYTRMLVDVARGASAVARAVRGARGSGCAWAAACPFVVPRCVEEAPPLVSGVACWRTVNERGASER